MKHPLFPRLAAMSVLAALAVSSFAQSISAQGMVGTPWTGPRAVRESVASIMKRDAKTPPRTIPLFKYQEDEGPDRSRLRQNPASPQTSQWPLPTLSSLFDGGKGAHSKPRFSAGGTFEASYFSECGFWPPDTMGDVSPTQVLICVNGRIKVFDKTGAVGALNSDTDTFFASVKRAGSFVCDPRVRYDRLENRWYVIMIDVTSSDEVNRLVLAVSDGPTITGSSGFSFYQFLATDPLPTGDANGFLDYPTLGVDSKALYIGGNMFSTTVNTSAFVIRKSSILSGGPMVVTAFRGLIGSSIGPWTAQGVDNDDPNSTTGYFIGVDNFFFGQLDLLRITDPGGTPSISASIPITVPSTASPVSPLSFGTTRHLDALDDRLFVAKIQTNAVTGAKTLWTSHDIGVNKTGVAASSPDRTGSRFYEIGSLDGTPTLVQSGTLFDASNDATSFWIPSMTMTRQGNVVLGSSSAGAKRRTSIAAAERNASMPLGTLQDPMILLTSSATYSDGTGSSTMRWGDYSHTVTDPGDGMTVWAIQMAAKTNTDWGVYVSKLIAPPPATITSTSPAIDPGATSTVTVTGTSTNNSGFFDAGAGFTKHLSASVSGGDVTVQAVRFISPTSVEVDLTVASTAAGRRDLTIVNPDGQSTTLANAVDIKGNGVAQVNLPATINSGGSVTGTVVLGGPVTGSAMVVSLSSSDSILTVPATVTVPVGQSTADFTLTAGTVSVARTVTVTAAAGASQATGTISVRGPDVSTLTLIPTSVIGGSSTTAKLKVTLTNPAPAGGAVIKLSSSNTAVASLPATLTIPAGAMDGSATITHSAVGVTTRATLRTSYQGLAKGITFTVQPARPSGLTFSLPYVTGGSSAVLTATATLPAPAPTGGLILTVSTSDPSVLTVDSTIVVLEGETSVTFPVTHFSQATRKTAAIYAGTASGRASAAILVLPPSVASIVFTPTTSTGGLDTVITGTVTLTAPAAKGGAVASVSATPSSVTLLSNKVSFAEGQDVGTFKFTTSGVQTDTVATFTATLNGVAKRATFTIQQPKLRALTLTPKAVVGGSATQVVLTAALTGPAPAGGVVINITSSNLSVATVPATITVPEGQTIGSVVVSHKKVTVSTAVFFSGTSRNISRSVGLTVKP